MDYDSIGWELAQGSGFQLEFTDPEFAAPYIEGGVASRIPRRKGPQIMTYRPPLLPLLAAGANRFLGRQFYAVRVMNTAATAGVCALVVWTVSRMMGPLPALIALINFMLVDERTRVYARSLYTESLGAFVIAVVACLLIAYAKRPRSAVMVAAG
jgi:hypothetical protein